MEMITLNLIPKGISPVCHASQYDKGRVIRCNLVDGLQGYVLSGETAVLNVIKPDNNIVTEALTATLGNTYIDIITTEQMCAVAGKNECEIRLTKGDVEVGTLNFIMQVEADVTTGGIESETVIHNLETTISDMVKEEIEAISPEEELSGAMASFETHEIAPLVDCKVKIEAIQSGSGTPSPDNVRPITGFTECNVTRTGKNLLKHGATNTTLNGLTFTVNSDGSFSVNGTAIANTSLTIGTGAKAPQKLCQGMTYTLSGGHWANTQTAYIQLIYKGDVSGNTISIVSADRATTYTAVENATLTGIYINFVSGKTFNNDIVKPQFELGSTATTYEAYNGTTYPITWNDEAGTVYGGSLDVTTGLLTVTWAYIDTWTNVNFTFNGSTATYTEVRCALSNAKAYGTSNMKSNKLETGPADLYKINGRANTEYIHFDVPLCANAAEAKQWIIDNGIAVIYELATPQTIQLTPTEINTILGVNNIWADTGDIDVVYHHELTARYVYFDNTGTDLTATNVEAAIKELWSRLQ